MRHDLVKRNTLNIMQVITIIEKIIGNILLKHEIILNKIRFTRLKKRSIFSLPVASAFRLSSFAGHEGFAVKPGEGSTVKDPKAGMERIYRRQDESKGRM